MCSRWGTLMASMGGEAPNLADLKFHGVGVEGGNKGEGEERK